ncbi:MAG: hypothetical protein WKG00_39185 [Polyangiaceae bacterium]
MASRSASAPMTAAARPDDAAAARTASAADATWRAPLLSGETPPPTNTASHAAASLSTSNEAGSPSSRSLAIPGVVARAARGVKPLAPRAAPLRLPPIGRS